MYSLEDLLELGEGAAGLKRFGLGWREIAKRLGLGGPAEARSLARLYVLATLATETKTAGTVPGRRVSYSQED